MAAVVWLLMAALAFVWSIGAVYFFHFLPDTFRTIAATAYSAAGLILLYRIGWKSWRTAVLLPTLLVLMLTWSAKPSRQRNWAADNQYHSTIAIDGDGLVTVDRFRSRPQSADHQQSDSPRPVTWSKLRFRLRNLRRVWFVVHRFTSLESIAHNFLTFEIQREGKSDFLTVSVEVRREPAEQFSPIKGLYQQYELIYVIADEPDQIGSRTVLSPNDRVWMFPVNAEPLEVQTLFKSIADRVNRLSEHPEFYHSLTNNCTNNLVVHTYGLTPTKLDWLDPRVVLPGLADRLAFARGLIGNSNSSFEEFAAEHRIDDAARRHGLQQGFSKVIRRASERNKSLPNVDSTGVPAAARR